jgi:UDP-N-acetylmuramate--alanine ligase
VLSAARATLARRLIVVFQPHRYSRTHQLFDAFGPSLAGADEIVLTGIYGAGEEPIAGVTAEALAAAIRHGSGRPVRVVDSLDAAVTAVVALVRPGDAVITMGAGSIGSLPPRLVQALGQKGRR